MSSPSSPQQHRVSPNQTTTFPLETMTEQQRKVFEKFIDTRYKTQLNVREPIWLALLLAGQKPATEITTLSLPNYLDGDQSPITDEEVAEVFGLVAHRWDKHDLFVSRTHWWIGILPSQQADLDAYHRRLGCFFGFPEEDIKYFLSSDNHNQTMPEELVADGVFQPGEMAFERFIPQGKDDSIEGYERAIKAGKNNRKIIETYANKWGLQKLDDYAERLYQDTIEDYSSFGFS